MRANTLHTPIKIPKAHNTTLIITAKHPSRCIVIKLIKNNTIANNNEHTLNIISVLFICYIIRYALASSIVLKKCMPLAHSTL